MIRTTNGTRATSVRGFRSIAASLSSIRCRSGVRTILGVLAFRAFALALAWVALFGRAGLAIDRRFGLVCRPDRCDRSSRVGLRPRGGVSTMRFDSRADPRPLRGRGFLPDAVRRAEFFASTRYSPSTRCNARRRTGALRGLRSTSAELARSAPRVSATNSGPCPGSSTGRPDGVRDAVAVAN